MNKDVRFVHVPERFEAVQSHIKQARKNRPDGGLYDTPAAGSAAFLGVHPAKAENAAPLPLDGRQFQDEKWSAGRGDCMRKIALRLLPSSTPPMPNPYPYHNINPNPGKVKAEAASLRGKPLVSGLTPGCSTRP